MQCEPLEAQMWLLVQTDCFENADGDNILNAL